MPASQPVGRHEQPVPSEVTIRSGGRAYRAAIRDGEVLLPKDLAAHLASGSVGAVKEIRRSGPKRIALKPEGASSYGSRTTIARLIAVLGSNAVADLLGVARDRPGRWARGEEVPDPSNRVSLADLDALVGHLLATFTPEQAGLWLTGDNAHLAARPLDVYRIHGSGPVVAALRAHGQGAFA